MSDLSFEQVITLSDSLSPLEKVRLVEHVMHSLKNDIEPKKSRDLLYGLWQGVTISSDDMDKARHEMWGAFPHEDV